MTEALPGSAHQRKAHLLDVEGAAQLPADSEGGPLQRFVDEQHVVLPGLLVICREAALLHKRGGRYYLQATSTLLGADGVQVFRCLNLGPQAIP